MGNKNKQPEKNSFLENVERICFIVLFVAGMVALMGWRISYYTVLGYKKEQAGQQAHDAVYNKKMPENTDYSHGLEYICALDNNKGIYKIFLNALITGSGVIAANNKPARYVVADNLNQYYKADLILRDGYPNDKLGDVTLLVANYSDNNTLRLTLHLSNDTCSYNIPDGSLDPAPAPKGILTIKGPNYR